MPFRYVVDGDGNPMMPPVSGSPRPAASGCDACRADCFQGMKELIQKDADKAVDDLF